MACEAELALLHGESKGHGLNAAAAAGDVEKLRSLAKISGVNTVCSRPCIEAQAASLPSTPHSSPDPTSG